MNTQQDLGNTVKACARLHGVITPYVHCEVFPSKSAVFLKEICELRELLMHTRQNTLNILSQPEDNYIEMEAKFSCRLCDLMSSVMDTLMFRKVNYKQHANIITSEITV
jgi:hypothetical protein